MTSQPEKDCGGLDGPGMATRARSQQPIVNNLFNNFTNLNIPKKIRTFPDRRVACDPWETRPYSIVKSTPAPMVVNAHWRGQYLVSPAKGHDKVNKKNIMPTSSSINSSRTSPEKERGHDDKNPTCPEKERDKDNKNPTCLEKERGKGITKSSSPEKERVKANKNQKNSSTSLDGGRLKSRTVVNSAMDNENEIRHHEDMDAEQARMDEAEKLYESRRIAREQKKMSSASKLRTSWATVEEYIGSWTQDLPEILEPFEGTTNYLGGQIPPPFEIGKVADRVNSIRRDANHQVVLQWLAAEGSERLTNGQKIFAEQLFDMWTDFREVEHKFPTVTPAQQSNQDKLNEWVFRVSQRSPLVRALTSFRNAVCKLNDDIEKWTIALVMRSQNKDGTPFRQHPLTVETVKHAKLAWLATDITLRAIAGPGFNELDWASAGEIYSLQNNTFRKLLFDRVGALLDIHHIDIEHDYPWLVRYTDNVPRDAPSQVPLYRHIREELDKRGNIGLDEILEWHYKTRPVSKVMIVDLK